MPGTLSKLPAPGRLLDDEAASADEEKDPAAISDAHGKDSPPGSGGAEASSSDMQAMMAMMQRLMEGRMYPLTLDGLDRATRELTR